MRSFVLMPSDVSGRIKYGSMARTYNKCHVLVFIPFLGVLYFFWGGRASVNNTVQGGMEGRGLVSEHDVFTSRLRILW